jgi:hypothetical protein
MVVALSADRSIDEIREAADDLIADLRDGDIDRDEAQHRKDELIAEIDRIVTALTDSDGQITTIET